MAELPGHVLVCWDDTSPPQCTVDPTRARAWTPIGPVSRRSIRDCQSRACTKRKPRNVRSLQSRSDRTSPSLVIGVTRDPMKRLRESGDAATGCAAQRAEPTSAFLEGGALGVLAQLHLSIFGQLSQRGGLSLLVLFALAAIVAALRLPLPPLLLLSAGGRRWLLCSVVDDILLLLEYLGGGEEHLMHTQNLNLTILIHLTVSF